MTYTYIILCKTTVNTEVAMAKINNNYLKLPGNYLFSTIGKKVREYSDANPEAKIIRLGIGDVTQPIADEVIKRDKDYGTNH